MAFQSEQILNWLDKESDISISISDSEESCASKDVPLCQLVADDIDSEKEDLVVAGNGDQVLWEGSRTMLAREKLPLVIGDHKMRQRIFTKVSKFSNYSFLMN